MTHYSPPIDVVLSQLQSFYRRDPIKDRIIVIAIAFSAIAIFGLCMAWTASYYK